MTAANAVLDEAVRLLRAGQLVAFPTETVYGLGADARNAAAVARVFEAKGRPAGHPLIVHLAGAGAVREWASDFAAPAQKLARAFWPGPLTLVLPRAPDVLPAVTGGQDSIALRVPSHPLAQALLAAFGGGIAAPSANRYGRVSPTCAAHVREELGERVALVLDGGDCEVGLESTIVACLGGELSLLRPGIIGRAEIEAVAGPLADTAARAPRVPGSSRTHYAPATPLELVAADRLESRCTELVAAGYALAVLARRPARASLPQVTWRVVAAAAPAFGHDLYATLRSLDRLGVSGILVERVPESEEWAAVRDRLRRAAARDTPDGT